MADAVTTLKALLSFNPNPDKSLLPRTGAPESSSQQQEQHHPQPDFFYEIGQGYCAIVFSAADQTRDLIIKKVHSFDPQLGSQFYNDFVIGTRVWEVMHRARHFLSQVQRKAADGVRWDNDLLPRSPRYHQFFHVHSTEFRPWWRAFHKRFPRDHRLRPRSLMVEERVMPLPELVRNALIELYCPPEAMESATSSPENQDCLARLYLGRRRPCAVAEAMSNDTTTTTTTTITNPPSKDPEPESSAFFSLQNFPLHLDQAEQICDLTDLEHFTRQMARALSVMHYACEVDASEVEFVLGAPPSYGNFTGNCSGLIDSVPPLTSVGEATEYGNFLERKKEVYMWIIDFGKVGELEMTVEGSRRAAKAVEENDPYFPKPPEVVSTDEEVEVEDLIESRLWRVFSECYLETSRVVNEWKGRKDCEGLAVAFLEEWQRLRREKADGGAQQQ